MEIAYGNRICRRKFRKFRVSGSCGNRIWKSHMEIAYVGASFANFESADLAEIAYGNRIWKSHMSAQVSQMSSRRILRKSHMEIAYGNRICRRKFRKCRVGGSCGNRIWKSHM